MRLFLHVGSHKTGTTAIQRFGANRSTWLKTQGLLYPNLDLIGLPKKRSHLAIFSGLCDLPGFNYGVDRHEALRFLVAAAEEARGGGPQALLLSAESIWRMSAPVRDVAFGVIAGVFHDFAITVVAGIRRQDRLFESMYRNDFKNNRAPTTVREALRRRDEMLNYSATLDSIEKWFPGGDHTLLPYSKGNRDTYVAEFFRSLGVEVPGAMTPSQMANPSFDVVDCLAIRELWRREVELDEIRAFRDFALAEPISTQFTFLDESLTAYLRERYLEGNRQVAARFPALRHELAWEASEISRTDYGDRDVLLAHEVDQRLLNFSRHA